MPGMSNAKNRGMRGVSWMGGGAEPGELPMQLRCDTRWACVRIAR